MMSSAQHLCEEGAARVGESGAEGWRLLAVLESATLVLVALALMLHAVRTRLAAIGAKCSLHGRRVLIAQAGSDLSRELAQQLRREGCHVTLLSRPGTAPHELEPSSADLEIISCDIRSRDQVRELASRVEVDLLVVCGAETGEGLDDLARSVSEELYANFHVLEEIGSRLARDGRLVWVCGPPGRGGYAEAARALHKIARTLLEQVARRRGCRAVWCEARGEPAGRLAARVIRTVTRNSSLPTSADVFRELVYKVRTFAYETFSRFCKLWT